MSERDQIESEAEFLYGLQSVLGNGPCGLVGCPGCACEMDIVVNDIKDRLKLLTGSEEAPHLEGCRPRTRLRCGHSEPRRDVR